MDQINRAVDARAARASARTIAPPPAANALTLLSELLALTPTKSLESVEIDGGLMSRSCEDGASPASSHSASVETLPGPLVEPSRPPYARHCNCFRRTAESSPCEDL